MTPDEALAKAVLQPAVLRPLPSRVELLSLGCEWPLRPVTVRFHRNFPIEHGVRTFEAFLRYAGYQCEPTIGPYDDTLAFADLDDADHTAEVIWMDFRRLTGLAPADLAALVAARVRVLRGRTDAPILVLNHPDDGAAADTFNAAVKPALDHLPSVFLCPLSDIKRELGSRYLDSRRSAEMGTDVSMAAFTLVTRALALSWLPAAWGRSVKAVAVDLDHTLYDGTIGEDGPDGVRVTESHLALQRALRDLRRRGVLIAVLSRNEPEDVEELFRRRSDFPLRAADVDSWQVSWDSKAAGVRRIAEALRISSADLLVVDDNPGELASVVAEHPSTEVIHACSPDLTTWALQRSPGLFSFGDRGADTLRAADLAANRERDRLHERVSLPEYLAALGMSLEFSVDRLDHVPRLAELSSRVNQFTTALLRLDEVEIYRRMNDPTHRVVSVRLSDRLSDSGVIAFVAAVRKSDTETVVEDVCMSCRALGRGMEGFLLAQVLVDISRWAGTPVIRLACTRGPRNGPALRWLAATGDERGDGRYEVTVASTPAEPLPITVTWQPGVAVNQVS